MYVGGGSEVEALDGENEHPENLVRKKRILGGEVVNDNVGIFVASVQRRADRAHLCVGTLVTLRHLVTTCHCVAHSDDSSSGITTALPEGHIVIAGSKNSFTLDNQNTRNVSRMEADYRCRYNSDAAMWEYNLGYITVLKAFRYIENKLGTIKKLHNTQKDLDDELLVLMSTKALQSGGSEFCMVYGWGGTATKTTDGVFDVTTFPDPLNHKAVQFITLPTCQVRLCTIGKGICRYNFYKNKCFCVAASGDGVGPLCDGDSGAPLICKEKFYGVGEVVHECGAVKVSLFFKLDIESIKHYILSGTSFPKINYPLFFIMSVLTIMPV
ncbi:granzyme K-like [Cimex lectularius]|uniref:Peptidase S1 domain-containing protein n=1 Tax=Cimex lectularius TaxID=79782 RepID=A0A8I6SEL3_CIMLE|nr:granzyme K-like [Cimex lectularius]